MGLEKIVSGGQTGVDRAALDAALAFGVEVGGWCPAGRRAEDGTIPERYPLTETPTAEYAQRTVWNVRDSDGTLLIADAQLEGGTRLTREEAEVRGKPCLHVRAATPDAIQRLREWLVEYDIRVLNVAGPRASEVEGIYEVARRVLDALLKHRTSDDTA